MDNLVLTKSLILFLPRVVKNMTVNASLSVFRCGWSTVISLASEKCQVHRTTDPIIYCNTYVPVAFTTIGVRQ